MKEYSETNMVSSLVIYEWSVDLGLIAIKDMFEQVAELVGRPPDIATLLDEKNAGRDYLYRNFIKRDMIHKKDWVSLGYLWKRNETLSDFAIELGWDRKPPKRLEFYLDAAAVEDAASLMRLVAKLIMEDTRPIYGIGYGMPYYWGPRAFALGSVADRYATVEKTFYGAPEWVNERSRAFRKSFMADEGERNLDLSIRDVYELNLLSEGHLNRQIEGLSLREWIEKTGQGELHQVNTVTWRWHVPYDRIEEVRRPLIAAGITILRT